MFMPSHREAQSLTNILESVAKHSMPQVVDECRRQRYLRLMIFVLAPACLYVTLNNPH
jgi:hypothetical protein